MQLVFNEGFKKCSPEWLLFSHAGKRNIGYRRNGCHLWLPLYAVWPYDPETHAPSGYYDMDVAEFEQEGMGYQTVAEQMELEEVVKVVSSIVCGEEVVIDK